MADLHNNILVMYLLSRYVPGIPLIPRIPSTIVPTSSTPESPGRLSIENIDAALEVVYTNLVDNQNKSTLTNIDKPALSDDPSSWVQEPFIRQQRHPNLDPDTHLNQTCITNTTHSKLLSSGLYITTHHWFHR